MKSRPTPSLTPPTAFTRIKPPTLPPTPPCWACSITSNPIIIIKNIIHYPETDSTNDEAKRLIKKGATEGTVIVADSQTKGRGKPGSSWYSPAGAGVYLSVIIKPYKNPRDLSPVTRLGAKAAVAAIQEICGLSAEIKLPNDVLLNGKKVGGILVERVVSGHLIIGIGVNINNEKKSFPKDLADTATSLKVETGENFSLAQFIKLLLLELDSLYLEYLKKV